MPKAEGFYVYVLTDWAGTPRWVGAGSGQRWNTSRHGADGNPRKAAFLQETRDKIGRIPVRIAQDGLSREQARELEKAMIKALGRHPDGPLANLAEGGEASSGIRRSEEMKARIAATLTGRKRDPAATAKQAEKLRGRTVPREIVEKRRAGSIGKKRTPEQLERIRAAAAARPSRKGIPKSDEVKARMSAATKARWARDRTPRAAKGPDGKFVKS